MIKYGSVRVSFFSPSLPPPLSSHLLYLDVPRSQKDLSCKRALKQAAFLSPGVVLPPHNSSRSQALINHTLVSKGFEDSLSRGNYRMCSVLWVILPELSPLHYHICPQRGLESLTQTSPALQLSHQNVPWELCSLLHGLAGFLRNSFLFSK